MKTCDWIFTNVQIVDVYCLRTVSGWVGIQGSCFVYVEEGEPPSCIPAYHQRDLKGLYIAPGLIDSHMHIESSLLTPKRFAEAVLPHGTTTILADPHELANAGGTPGLLWFLEACKNLPLDVKVAFPSCIPATSSELEWVREPFDSETLKRFRSYPQLIALGEVMDYRYLPHRKTLLEMIQYARESGYLVEGHVPTLQGMELSEYISFGIGSDHTLTTPQKMQEQISKGMAVMLQAKSITPPVIEAVQSLKDKSRILLVTDDMEPSLLLGGHLNTILRQAIRMGMEPLEAWASSTIRPARYLGLDRGMRKKGGIAPGYEADFLILEDLNSAIPLEVWVGGKEIAQKGKCLTIWLSKDEPTSAIATSSVSIFSIPKPLSLQDFTLPTIPDGIRRIHTIRLMDQNTSLTQLCEASVEFRKGFPVWNNEVKKGAVLTVISRNAEYHSFAVVENLGMMKGAYASSFAHDCHNLLVVGRDPVLMAEVAQKVLSEGGGIALKDSDGTELFLALPIFGIISDDPLETVARELRTIEDTLREWGIHRERPFLILSLLSLSVSPYTKVTDRGILDTEKRQLIPLVTKEMI